ncbi:MAG: WG repeat-containing protein [Bacteroidales bacterium]|jgi:hypothetical protein|nr:WG repeat-containing protein [Bacteroidales bacterium]
MKKVVITALVLFLSISFCMSQNIRQAVQQQNKPMELEPIQCSNGKWGYRDKNTKAMVVPCKYDGAEWFQDGLARVNIGGVQSEPFSPISGGKWGFVDKIGKEVVPLIYDWVDNRCDWRQETTIAARLNGKYGFVSKIGNVIIPFMYDNVRMADIDHGNSIVFFSEGLLAVQLNGKWGFIDQTGKEIISFKYGIAENFVNGLAVVSFNGKNGLIDKTGKEIIPMKYDWIFSSIASELAEVQLNGKRGFVNKQTGKEVISPKYDKIGSEDMGEYDYYEQFDRGLFVVQLNSKWGMIDKTGKEVLPIRYDYIGWFFDELAPVQLNGRWGFVDATGAVVVPIVHTNRDAAFRARPN